MIELSKIQSSLTGSKYIISIKKFFSWILSDKNMQEPLKKDHPEIIEYIKIIPNFEEIMSFCGFISHPEKKNCIYVNPEKVCNVEIFRNLIKAL